eukprot:TRINITY_DN9441_c0_g4_i1.p1 TRINITY_DN9441_c0_g4~~TRINITY_DN9441_c0_g4_i1.p1  ORF type:complete len:336 (+),score=76.39 TRINITY_DN9441_c0_g4_i1:134-1141(+)
MQSIVRNGQTETSLELVAKEIPKPKPGFILVKVHAAPINPSDLLFIRGVFGDPSLQPQPPVTVGFECSGIVADTGEGVSPDLRNKHVCLLLNCHRPDFTGTWATYTVVPADAAVVVPSEVGLDVAAVSQANPPTAMGVWHVIRSEKHKAVVLTAAASSIGKMLMKLCREKGVETVNVVRREENVKTLKELGAKYVLDSESPEFEKELQKVIEEVKPSAFFDAVCGKVSELILEAMPCDSTMYQYGSLGSEEIKVNGTKLRTQNKTIKGFTLYSVFKTLSEEQKKEYMDFIWNDLKTGGKIFKTSIAAKFGLKSFKEALSAYPKMASKGKVLLVPE